MSAPPPTNNFELPFTVEALEAQFNWTTDYAAYVWWSVYGILNAPQATAADVISEDLNWLFLSEAFKLQPKMLSWRKWVWVPPESNSDGDLNLTAALAFTKTHRTTSTWDVTLAHEENWTAIARAEGARSVAEWMDYLKISRQQLPVLGLAAHDCRIRIAENLNEFIQGGTRRRARLQHIPWTQDTCYLSIVTGGTPRDAAIAAMQTIHEPWNDSEAGAIDRDEDITFGEAQQAFFELVLTALPMIFNEYETNPRVDRPTPSAKIQATINHCRRLVSDSARESTDRDGPWHIGLSPANVMWTAYTPAEVEQLQAIHPTLGCAVYAGVFRSETQRTSPTRTGSTSSSTPTTAPTRC